MIAQRLYSLFFAFFLSLLSLPTWSLGLNLALPTNGGVATASSTYSNNFSVSSVNNGDRKGTNWGAGGGWNDGTASTYPDWVQITFNGVKYIEEIDLYTVQDNYTNPIEPTAATSFTQYGLKNFEVQYWNGTSWLSIPGGSVSNNTLIWRKFTFPAISTDRIRIYITNALAGYSRITELEVYEAGGVSNTPPSVNLSAPANNSNYTAPANIILSATANDSDGTISQVEFYNGAALLNTDTNPPYSYTWNNIPQGNYSLIARAIDNQGASSTSTPINIDVNPAGGQARNLALPANGGVATASSTYSNNFPVSGINNGDRKGTNWGAGGGWNDSTASTYPDWVQISFNGPKIIDKIDLFTVQDNYTNPAEPTATMSFTQYGLKNFEVQYWNGASWVTIPGGSITNNTLIWRSFSFVSINTDRIRIYITHALAGYSRITELEVYEAAVVATPPSVTLSANPQNIVSGSSSTLTWSSTDATSCTASGAWSGSQATSGSHTLTNLTTTGTYALTCTNASGSTTQSTTIIVAPVMSSITIGETAILASDDSGNGGLLLAQQTSLSTSATIQTLSFYVTTASGDLRLGIYDATGPNGGPGAKRAETDSITPVAGWNTVNVTTPVFLTAGTYWLAYAPSSSSLVFKMEPTGSAKWYAYPYGPMPATFSATPISGPYHWSLYATLETASALVPTVTLSANPATLSAGGSSTLTWSSINATTCTASGAWSGTQPTAGSLLLTNILTSGTYTLSCTGVGGSASQSVTVTVTPSVPMPTVSLSASPTVVANGGTSTLSWSSANATSCTASGAWSGNKVLSGNQSTGVLSSTSSYTLTCVGAGGSASQSATVTVSPAGSSPLDSLQPGQWYMAPNSNVSALDPCPARNCSYSGSDGQAHVMGAWNSGAYDTKRDRLIIWGGGHNNYGGNEIYTFGIATMSWARITEPSIVLPQDRADCFPAGVVGCVGGSNLTGYYSDGKPASRHTANALAYAANVDQFFSLALGSSFGSTGRQGFDVDSFNFDTDTWKSDWQKSPGNPYGAAGTIAAYNPVTGKIWYHASMNSPLAEFDPTIGPTGSWRTSTATTPNNGQAGVLMDHKRNRMVAIGEYGGSRVLRVWDLNNIDTPPENQPTSGVSGGIALESARGVGFVYDPVGDRYVAWHGGTAVYALDPVTWVWSVIPLYSGNTVTPTAPNNEGTYGRMSYVPSKQVFILVNQTTENVYFFKLTNGVVPPPIGTPAPTVSLTANPINVASNGETTLTWSSTNATSCTASGAWSGPRAPTGAESISALNTTSTFTLTCSGAGGSASQSVTVTVSVAAGVPVPTVSLSASFLSVSNGGTSTLTWSSTDATSCIASGAWTGSKATSGSQTTGPLSTSSTYTLSCTGSGGSASESVTISVVPGTPPPVGLITSVQLVNNSGGNQANAPVTFGHALKQGDVPAGFTLIAKDSADNPVALQVDKKATYADGSLRHAILTAKLANLPAAAAQALGLYAQADSAPGDAVSLANLLATSFDSQVSLNVGGVIYAASARNLLQTMTPKSWLAGPEVSEWIVGGPVKTAGGVAHPHLTAYFHVRAYAGTPITKVRVDAVVENNWTFKSGAGTFSYIPAVTVGSTTIYNNGGASLPHYHHTRWHQVGWWNNTDSKIFVKPDTRYLRDSKTVPNYANVAPQESLLDGYTQSVEPMKIANLRSAWSPGGAHAQIGLMPEWYASYVMSNGDVRAYNAVLANDSAGGSFSYHYRDENTGLPVSIDTYPNVSEQDPSSLVLGVGGNPNLHDAEHQPLIGYLGYLLTGDYYYLEELQFLANWGMLWHPAGNRGGSDGIIGGRGSPAGNREIAWAVRTQAAAGAISPDLGSFKSYFTAKANNNLNSMAAAWGANSPTSLGIRLDVGYFDAGYYAPWQMDFLVAVVNLAVDLGYSSSNAITLRNTFNKWPTGRMGQDNSGYCPYYAALYNFGNDVSDRGVISGGVYRTFAQLYQYKFPTESAQPCPTSGVMRVGYGGPNTVDYYSNVMQPALAMAVDSGVASQATWNKFLSIAPTDYSLGGTWGIVPRSSGSVVAP